MHYLPPIDPKKSNNNPNPQLQEEEAQELQKQVTDQQSPLKPAQQQSIPLTTNDESYYTKEQLRAFNIRGVISVIGGVLVHLVLGTFYVWGSISAYIAAYMRQYDDSVTLDFMSIIFPILGVITMSVLSFGIKLAEKVGFQLTIAAGVFLISLAFLICSFLQNIYGFIIIYCVMVGVPGGLLYMLPIICGWRYFPFHRGMVSGLTIGGYGFGSFIFNQVCRAIVNPDNLKPTLENDEAGHIVKYFDHRVYDHVPLMLQILAACYIFLGMIGTAMIRFPTEIDPEKLLATLEKNKKKDGHIAVVIPVQSECSSIMMGVKSPAFAILIPLVLCSCTLGMLISNCYKYYGLELGIDDLSLTTTGSVAGVMNGCSRFFWATLTDKTSFKFTFMLISIINLVTSALLGYVGNNPTGYLLLIAAVYLAEGGLLATYPVVCYKIFNKKVGALMYGFLFFMVGISNMFGYLLYRFARITIGYVGVFWICFGISVLGIFLGLCLKETGIIWGPSQVATSDDQIIVDAQPLPPSEAEPQPQPQQ